MLIKWVIDAISAILVPIIALLPDVPVTTDQMHGVRTALYTVNSVVDIKVILHAVSVLFSAGIALVGPMWAYKVYRVSRGTN